jgi:hypothetical protein
MDDKTGSLMQNLLRVLKASRGELRMAVAVYMKAGPWATALMTAHMNVFYEYLHTADCIIRVIPILEY